MGKQIPVINLIVLVIADCFSPVCARVLDATVKPTFTISQIYSDNLRLNSSGYAEDGFVTQLSPTILIDRDSARSKFNLNARLQLLMYEGINIGPRVYPQLQMSSKTELLDDTVFFDSFSRISQGNPSALGSITSSNIYQSSSVNSTTYSSFGLSPYWKPHLGGYANAELRFGYNYFNNTGGDTNAAGIGLNTIPNLESHSFQESLFLTTGRQFESIGLSGRFSFQNQNQQYQARNTSNLRFRSVNGEVHYRLVNDVGAFIQVGYYNNIYPNNAPTRNGLYATPGLSWTPSPNFSLAGGYGINSNMANLTWRPSQRTSLQISYRNSQVGGSTYGMYGGGGGGITSGLTYGLGDMSSSGTIPGFNYSSTIGGFGQMGGGAGMPGTGYPTGALGATNAGTTWNGGFEHNTRTTTWSANYYTITTSIQQYLSSYLNMSSAALIPANDRDISSPNFTNNLMVVKRAQGSVRWLLSKNSLTLTAYQSNIKYLSGINRRPQDIFGVTATWNWHMSPRTSATLSGTWQSSELQGNATSVTNQKTEYLTAILSVNRMLSPSMTGSLLYSHTQTTSDNIAGSSNIAGGLGSYDANRITANLSINF